MADATAATPVDPQAPLTEQEKAEMLADEDPLLISQSLTYVTDDGSVLHSFHSAPYSTGMYRTGIEASLVVSRTHTVALSRHRLQDSVHTVGIDIHSADDCRSAHWSARHHRCGFDSKPRITRVVLVQSCEICRCNLRWQFALLDWQY